MAKEGEATSLVRRAAARPAVRGAAITTGGAAALTASIVGEPLVAHALTATSHLVGAGTMDSALIGLGAGVYTAGLIGTGSFATKSRALPVAGTVAATAAGVAGVTIGAGLLTQDWVNAVPAGTLVGGFLGVGVGSLASMVVTSTHGESFTRDALRATTFGAGALGLTGIACEVIGHAHLAAVPGLTTVGEIGTAGAAAAVVPGAMLGIRAWRTHRAQRVAARTLS